VKTTKTTFENILKETYQNGETLQIPYIIKNGEFKDKDFFHLLRFLDDEPIKIISTTKYKLIVEITNQGIGNILKHINEERY
jgi:hypothetical protein